MDKEVATQLSSQSPSDKQLSVADLKAYLKHAGVSSTGDKGSLWWRCKTHHTVITLKLVTSDDAVPTTLKPAQLRKAAARVGVSPIGTPDEMLEGLVDYLTKEHGKSSTGKAASSSASKDPTASFSPSQPKGPALAEAILSLSDTAAISPIRILQLSDPSLQHTSPTSDLRKAYLKISLHIHPDRIGGIFKEATKAFQVLVTAYETLTSPDYVPSDEPTTKKGKKKTQQISRSNEGCHTTKIHCPRCHSRWGDKVEGNPEWTYNVMMQGLKSFHCSTCLLQFGCMSAEHKCPHCRSPFSYSPDDYHRKISCSSTRCTKKFGFYMHHMSDLALRNLREEVLQRRDDAAKRMVGLKRRAKRAARNEEEEMDLHAFAAGLADECPKCGADFGGLLREGISAEIHLMNCTDEKSHQKQRAKKDAQRKKEREREEASALQNDAESKAAWGFLGKDNNQLYLLSETQLQKEMKEKGISSSDGADKADMIAALVNQERSLVVMNGGGDSANASKSSNATLPSMSTLQRMDVDELRAVLASHGMDAKKIKGKSKRKLLELLEDKVYKNDDDDVEEVKLLTNSCSNCSPKKPVAKRRKKKAIEIDSDDDSDGSDCVQKKPPRKNRRKKKAIEIDSDDDSDGDWNPNS
mmetsp:Transcript_35112/g.84739  ORF Transcript_35112/g.84739 Transcript_35112/m.84739 type:complete len:638 (+) Transcript_35112:69-1982(+)